MSIEGFESVLAAAQAGAEWALTILYRELQPRVLRYISSREPGEAEDLCIRGLAGRGDRSAAVPGR